MASNSKSKQKKKFKINFLNIALVICIIVFCISSFRLIKYYLDSRANKENMKNISKSIDVKDSISDIGYDNLDKYVNVDGTNNPEYKYNIDFNLLKEQNPDTVGFLKVRGTDVEFVVVQGKDNDYYLTHNFEKNDNRAGWIFADYRNKLDGSDKNIVIYGHNMLNGTMFSSLSNVLKQDWLDEVNNRIITYVTPEGTSVYEVFSVYQAPDDDYYTQTDFATLSVFKSYIDTIVKKSIYNFDSSVNETSKVLTLITCGKRNSDRIVIHAKKLL